MMLYLVIIEDRHVSTDAYPYSDKEHALVVARKAVNDNARHPEMIEWNEPLTDGMIQEGWAFYVRYSGEGDNVRVIERELDKEY